MGAELGRISGPLLAENLVRHGIDLAFETDLLYFDVSNQRIGIKTAAPGRDFDINGTTGTTNLIVDTALTVPNFSLSSNTIQNLISTIYIQPNQSVDPIISSTKFSTADLEISNQLIKNKTLDSNIELNPIGTGKVQFDTDKVNVTGTLHATGNITWDGNIIIGDDSDDNVDLNADINSDIIPDLANTYDIGSLAQQWSTAYVNDVQTVNINVSNIVIDDIDLLLTVGNTFYVSVNGDDDNYGNHPQSTFATLKAALAEAVSGDTVIIFPGTYYEEFPLTVPQGVCVRGAGIRAVSVRPTLATNNNDAFLLNGDTIVEHLSVTDFFFDAANNKGYAFRFANDFSTVLRSPYINNVTVRTVGSVTSAADPYGYDAGDAGSGAYADGSVADVSSVQVPTMLFYSVTFITPAQDGLTALNGVRIEWLNCFTYFANRGLYLLNGTAGRYNQGTIFGAELRSINSANVYGVYGAVADGDECLGYVMAHNFAYIGNGKDLTNDPSLTIQANEIIELNDGHMYFESTDQLGDIRIGDIFYVSQATGQLAFDAQSINIVAGGNITIEGPSSTTIINEQAVQTGNIRIYDNTIASLSGPVNFLASAGAGNTYLNTDIYISGLTEFDSNLTVNSDTNLGLNSSSTINFISYLTQDINPKTTNQFYLGSELKRWDTVYADLLNVDGITEITTNLVTTNTTDTDLELVSNGIAIINVPSNNVEIDDSLTVNGTFSVLTDTYLQDLDVTGNILLTGNIGQTGDTYITGTFANNNIDITGASYFEVPNIRIYNNTISNQLLDQDLIFSANGTGGVDIEKIRFKSNEILNNWTSPTTESQKSIFFAPNGTGNTVVNSTKAVKIPVGSNTNKTITTAGEIRFNNTYNRYEGYAPNGLVSFNNLYNYATTGASFLTTSTKTTLSTGTLSVVIGEYTAQLVSTSGLSIGYKVVSGPGLAVGATITNIAGSIITVDLPHTSSSLGLVTFGPVVLNFSYVSGLQIGQTVTATGIQSGTVISSWTTTSVTLSKPISGNVVSGSAITFGPTNSTYITPELSPGTADNIIRFGIQGSVTSRLDSTAFYSSAWRIGNIDISTTNIQKSNALDLFIAPDSGTTNINNVTFDNSNINNLSSSAITLATTGLGYVKFSGVGAVVFPAGDNSERRLAPELGEVRYNTELEYLEVFDNASWIPAIGSSGAASEEQVDEIMNLWAVILG